LKFSSAFVFRLFGSVDGSELNGVYPNQLGYGGGYDDYRGGGGYVSCLRWIHG